MVVVELLGGLGNQMFQYALGRRLAFERACKLKLDLSGYADDAKRSYRLDRFAIVGELATRQDVARGDPAADAPRFETGAHRIGNGLVL